MMEQSHTSECHGYTILVTGLDNIVVTNAATSLCNVFHSALVSTLDVVTEWEEGITTQANTCVLCNPCFLLLISEENTVRSLIYLDMAVVGLVEKALPLREVRML